MRAKRSRKRGFTARTVVYSRNTRLVDAPNRILGVFGTTQSAVFIFRFVAFRSSIFCLVRKPQPIERVREEEGMKETKMEREKIAKEHKHIGTHWEMDQLLYKYSLNRIETISCPLTLVSAN
jgi:hypothetical protein